MSFRSQSVTGGTMLLYYDEGPVSPSQRRLKRQERIRAKEWQGSFVEEYRRGTQIRIHDGIYYFYAAYAYVNKRYAGTTLEEARATVDAWCEETKGRAWA